MLLYMARVNVRYVAGVFVLTVGFTLHECFDRFDENFGHLFSYMVEEVGTLARFVEVIIDLVKTPWVQLSTEFK